MGKDYSGLNPRSALGGGLIGTSIAPVWNASEIDSISTVFERLQQGQPVTQTELDATTMQLTRGLGHAAYDSQVRQLIGALYEGCGSPQAQAHMIGLLLSPENRPLLEQLLNAPDAENSLARVLSPEECRQLLAIASEPGSAMRVESLVQLVRGRIPRPATSTPQVPPMERALPGSNQTRSKRKEADEYESLEPSKKLDMGGDRPATLRDAVSNGDTARVKELIDQASHRAEITHQLAALGPQAVPVLRQLLTDARYSNVAYHALQEINQSFSQIGLQMQRDDSGPAPSTQTPSVLDTSALEQLLLSPETLPATLGMLIRLGPRGQASLCELLVSR